MDEARDIPGLNEFRAPVHDNRAITALFRVFGGTETLPPADARETAGVRGMHQGEFTAFATLIPLTVWAVIADLLTGLLGAIAAWLTALPLAFLALNIIPFMLAVRSPALQWKVWMGACVAWAVWRREAAGVVGLLSHAWIAIAVLYLVAALVIDWRSAMAWRGKAGIAWRIFLTVILHLGALAVGVCWGWRWGLACAAVIGGLWCLSVLWPACQWLGPVYRTTDQDGPLTTIDDGPDPHDTPVLLDLLDRHHVKAVFFVIGEKARAHPALIKEIVHRGHEIGNHTLTHPQGSFWCASPWRTWREISGCQTIIEEITGRKPTWFRAPVGHRNLFTHPVCGALGLRVMGWNRRGYDAVEKDASKVLARILPGLAAGDIVLMHEATPIAEEVLSGLLGAITDPPATAG